MSTTSVSLKTLHFLLQHMEANKRFEICQRCPALREFEKSVPLKIKSLVLKESYVAVNDTVYKLGIIRKCKVGEAPRYVTYANEMGGYSYEVDAYGIRDEADRLTATPGDVVINQHGEQVMFNEDERIGELEDLIRFGEAEIANLRGRRRSCRNLEKVNRIEEVMKDERSRILEYQCRRDNIPSNYELFLQLSKTQAVNEEKQETLEKYVHNKKYSEAMKQLTTVLFGGRCSPIFVTRFEFLCMQGVIRLPVCLKLHIEQLMFGANFRTSVEVLAPILHESSYPLKKLVVHILSNEQATSPIVNTAGILGIRVMFSDRLHIISAITNPVVHFKIAELSERTSPLAELVEHWIESKRPLGYNYTFHYDYEPAFAIEMIDILKRLNGKPVDDENVTIPMSEVTQLKVSYGPFPEFAPRSKWAFKFLTELIEH
ncbi:unnamed protein product [Caenorhabditis brenneri]